MFHLMDACTLQTVRIAHAPTLFIGQRSSKNTFLISIEKKS